MSLNFWWNSMGLFFFCLFTHPLMLIMILISQTLSFFSLNYIMKPSMWMSYLFFLVLVGGLLIVFIYLSALIPNELFKTPSQFFLLSTFLIYPMFYYKSTPKSMMALETPMNFSLLNLEKSILWLLIYLFMTMFTGMLMMNNLKTPLKQKIYEF